MTIILTSKNIEDIKLKNKKITSKLTKYKQLFNNWNMSQIIPSLKFIRSESIIKLIKQLDSDDLFIIKDILKDDVLIDQDSSGNVKNTHGQIDNLEFYLPEDFNCIDFCLYRNKADIGVTLWK